MNTRLLLGALLGAATIATVPSTASAAATCSYSPATKTMTVSYGASDSTLTLRNGSEFLVGANGTGFQRCGGGGQFATYKNTTQITIKAPFNPAGSQETIIDERFGKFLESTPNLRMTVMTGSGADKLTLLESSEADRINLHTSTGLGVGPAIDLDADGDIDLGMTAAGTVQINGGGGNDRLNARFATGYNVFLFGEGDSDILTGGAGSDWLDGGPGDDLLQSNLDNFRADYVDGGTSGFDRAATDSADREDRIDGVWA